VNRNELRLTAHGDSQRDREIARTKDIYIRKFLCSPSCKKVVLGGEEVYLGIDSGTKPYYKKITSFNNNITAGQYVQWSNATWLIIDIDWDNEIYQDGNMHQCTYNLKWQNENFDIVERWISSSNASSYNSGVEGDKVIEVGYDQILFYIPLDDETIKLSRDKRLFISNNLKNPIPYKITRIDSTSYAYNGIGCLAIICTETQLDVDNDNIDLFICDYKKKNDNSSITDSYKTTILFDSDYVVAEYEDGTTFKAEFTNDGVIQDITPKWILNCSFKDSLIINENGYKLIISTNDKSLIGRSFTINLTDINETYPTSSTVIDIIGFK